MRFMTPRSGLARASLTRAWLPIGSALLQTVVLQTGQHEPAEPWRLLAFQLVGIATGLSLFWRRSAPVAVLAVCIVGYVVQASLLGTALPAAVAVMTHHVARGIDEPMGSNATRGVRTVALVGGLVAVVAVLSWTGRVDLAGPYGVVVAAAAVVGLLTAVRAARERARAQDLLADQRLHIARDLHDVVGHGVGAITVQAGAARIALANGATEDARRVLLDIEAAGREVLREVRWMVGLMRDQSAARGLADVPALVDNARRSGLTVTLSVRGRLPDADTLPGETGYRIVQEGLTNVLRHSGARSADVRVEVGDSVHVDVRDDGSRGAQPPETLGAGLRGMRERVEALGGTLTAGPLDGGGGWLVSADLPARPSP